MNIQVSNKREEQYESGAKTRTWKRLVETRARTIALKPGALIPSSLVTITIGLSPETLFPFSINATKWRNWKVKALFRFFYLSFVDSDSDTVAQWELRPAIRIISYCVKGKCAGSRQIEWKHMAIATMHDAWRIIIVMANLILHIFLEDGVLKRSYLLCF